MKHLFLVATLSLMCWSASAAPLDGKMLFKENCASCHGDNGKGGTQAVKGPKLVGDASKWSAKLFVRAVLEGVDDEGRKLQAGMPHWKDASLKDDHGMAPTQGEIEAIHRYLKSIK